MKGSKKRWRQKGRESHEKGQVSILGKGSVRDVIEETYTLDEKELIQELKNQNYN